VAQQRRIVRLVAGDEAGAEFLGTFEVAFGVLAPVDADRPVEAAAARQVGQGVQRGFGAAEAGHEQAEARRSDVLAAAEAQPVAALGVA
jgi:hypothetical protein